MFVRHYVGCRLCVYIQLEQTTLALRSLSTLILSVDDPKAPVLPLENPSSVAGPSNLSPSIAAN